MAALLGYIVVALSTIAVVARISPPRATNVALPPTTDLADTARKVEAVLSGLAGFAFTSVVLLITLSGNRLDPHAERTVDLIALLVVAYLGFVVGAIMYAYTEPTRVRGVELMPAQHVIASAQFYRSIVQGWLALGPLIAIVGSEPLNRFVVALLLLAVLGGWVFHAANLATLGYAAPRFLVLVPATSAIGAIAFAGLVHAVPQLHQSNSVLFLVAAGAAIGATAHLAFHAARAARDDVPDVIVRRLPLLVAIDAHASATLMAFLWLAIADLI
jgi:hypothetical protein